MSSKPQIILIDDEPKMTKLLKLILLDAFDCEVETFNDPLQAHELLLARSFDVISIDHRMPELMGAELVKMLRINKGPNSKTPVLILTGYREEAEISVKHLDDLLFVEKPINDDSYIRNIKLALQMKKKQREQEV
jgi:DNA-binding NtrC family response regulator